MSFLLPTNDEFIEQIAKAIGRDRLYRDAEDLLQSTLGIKLSDTTGLDKKFDTEFERLWEAIDDESVWNREHYEADAIAAVNKINLLLLTMTA